MPISPHVLKRYLTEIFVETGTAQGDGVQLALDCGFKEVYSIEVNPELADKAKERFKDDHRVHIYKGDSSKELIYLLEGFPDYFNSATFWLDAHVNNSKETVFGNKCPVIQELDMIINECELEQKIILIDDMRLFRRGRRLWGGIRIEDIANKVVDAGYSVRYEDGLEPKDIMVVKK